MSVRPKTVTFILLLYVVSITFSWYLSGSTALTLIIGSLLLFYFPGRITLTRIMKSQNDLILSIGVSTIISGSIFLFYYTVLKLQTPIWPILTVSLLASIDSCIEGSFFEMKRVKKIADYVDLLCSKNKIAFPIAVAFLLLAGTVLTYFTVVQNDFEPFSEIYLVNSEKDAFGYDNTLQNGSSLSLVVGVGNHEKRVVQYHLACFQISNFYIDNTSIIAEDMYLVEYSTFTIVGDAPSIDSKWNGQWEKELTVAFNKPGEYKLFFFLFIDDLPPIVQNLTLGVDYADTDVSSLINDVMHQEYISVNLNVHVE